MRDDIAVLSRFNELADSRNIHLADSKLPTGAKSVYVRNETTQLIMVSNSISVKERVFEIAYCLGHATLHKDLNFNIFNNKDIPLKREINMEASRFANKLLALLN
jgi:Zn-dependent peptidase ImmA (M78 family)